jgi:hypothetical protein
MARNSGTQGIRRRALCGALGVGILGLAGCGGVFGGDSVREDQSEPPQTEFEWVQSTGYAATGNIVIEVSHEGGDPIDIDTLHIEIEDEDGVQQIPGPENALWSWDLVLDNERNFERLGEVMREGDVVAVTSNPRQGDLAPTEDVTGTVRLVWTSPVDDESTVLTSYELKMCVGNESDDVERCAGDGG